MRDQKATLVLLLVFCMVLASFPYFQVVEANPSSMVPRVPEPAFAIKGDGSVDPSTAPIRRDGDIYTLTDNIVGYSVIVERDNITLDGGGYTLRGNGFSSDDQNGFEHLNAGVFLLNRHRVTVRNMKISGFHDAINMFSYLGGSSIENRFENNLLTDNYYGMYILYSQSTVLRKNQMKNNTRNLCITDNIQVNPEPPNLYLNDIDPSNTVDEKPVIYWINKHGETVPPNAGYVALINCSDITVKNLDLSHNGQGILLMSTPNLHITQNRITNTDTGIFLCKSSNTSVTENNLENNGVCIEAHDSPATRIASNSLTRSGAGISLIGASQNSVVYGNSIIKNTGNGMFLSGISNATINHNNVSENNETGITLYVSYNNTVAANTITGNGRDGIGLWEEGTGNTISENLVANNSRFGFLIRYCSNNSIIGNMISKNSDSAIRFVGEPSNNLIYHNNFIENNNNGAQISFSTTFGNSAPHNVWDNGVEGNYWSNSKSSPYSISENNQDNHPLLAPIDFVSPEIPSVPVINLITTMPDEQALPSDGASPVQEPAGTDSSGTQTKPDQIPWLPVAAVSVVVLAAVAVAVLVYWKKQRV